MKFEFSFYLLLVSVIVISIFFILNNVLKLIYYKEEILYFVGGLLSSTLTIGNISLSILIIIILLALFFKRINKKFFYYLIQYSLLIILIINFSSYINISNNFWYNINFILYNNNLDKTNYLNLYYIIRFFRDIYPFIILFIIFFLILLLKEKKYYTFWYRYLRNFSHFQLIPMIISWLIYGIEYKFNIIFKLFGSNILNLLLNITAYFTSFYIVYGLLLLIYWLKRIGIQYLNIYIILFSLFILSSIYFIFYLVILLGIGISDIWMNYQKRINNKVHI